MASRQETRRPTTKGQDQEEGQGQAMNLEEIGKYRAEAQQRSIDAIRAAEERYNKANLALHGGTKRAPAPGPGTGADTVVSYQPPSKQAADHATETDAQQWLADTASDARKRCNRAMGMSQAPAAAHGGTKESSAAHAPAGAAPRQQTKTQSAGHEGGDGRIHLTRQEEMGRHGAHESSAAEKAARAAVEKHAADMGTESGGAARQGTKDTATAKDVDVRGVQATAETTQQAAGTTADYTKQAAAKAKDVTAGAAGTTVEYGKQAAAKTKDVTQGTGKAAAGYAKQAAVKGKDVTLSAGETAAEYARAAAEKAKEAAVATARTTAGYTQQTAVKAKDVTVSTGAQVAQKATEVTAGTAHRVAEYAKEKAEQGKASAARAADEAEEPGHDATARTEDSAAQAADRARDVTGEHRDRAGGMARGAVDTAERAKDRVKDMAGSVAQKAGDTAGRAKDASGGMAKRSTDTAGQARDRAKDTSSHAEHKACEVKGRASETGGATAKAKGGGDGDEETTIVCDVLEAVGATVVGLAQHTKGIVAGEEEVVPVEGGKAKKVAGAGAKEKHKTA